MEKIFKKVSRQPAGALTTYARFVWFALFFSSAFTRAAAADSSVCVAASHTCVIRDDFTTVCFGGNDYGQLGQGNTAPIGDGTDSNSDSFGDVAFTSELGDNLVAVDLGTGLTAKSLACGSQHTCAVLSDDTIKCWGRNDMGQLGQGSKTAIGDGPGEMGDALVAVDLGTGLTAKSVSCGRENTCAVLSDATIKCWGRNDMGQLGQGNTGYIGDFAGEMGDALVAVDLGTGLTAKSVSCGHHHTCAVLSDDTIKCWGRNPSGQLGQGSKTTIGDGSGDMGDALVAVDLGTGLTAKSVSGGGYHTCAVLSDATIKCWGDNGYGQLGQGNTATIGDGLGDMGDALVAVDLGTCFTAKSVSGGGYHTCAVLNDDSLKCWGSGYGGQIGEISIINADDCTYCISQVPTLFAHTRLTLSFIYRKILLTITQSATKPTTWATTWVSSLSASVALS